mgnify:CR=1 FL=1
MRSTGFRLTVMSLGLSVLSGCFGGDGMFRDRGQDYRRAKLSAPLELPPGVRSETLDDQYVVPGIQTHEALPGKFEAQRPEPLAKNVGTAEVKIQTLENNKIPLNKLGKSGDFGCHRAQNARVFCCC